MKYELIDSGNGRKLEKFGSYILSRPSSQALWERKNKQMWSNADMIFSREPENHWLCNKKIPKRWILEIENIKMIVEPSDFGHVGIFPEHFSLCKWIRDKIQFCGLDNVNILNLFAYSGAATIAAVQAGAKVCHLDASKPMIERAKENVKLNYLGNKNIRYILDDALQFVKRERKRNNFYQGIILDPPTFGRGPKKQVFKIEKNLIQLLEICADILAKDALFVVLSSHSPGITSLVLHNLLMQNFCKKGEIITKEMVLSATDGYDLPSGFCGIWEKKK